MTRSLFHGLCSVLLALRQKHPARNLAAGGLLAAGLILTGMATLYVERDAKADSQRKFDYTFERGVGTTVHIRFPISVQTKTDHE